MSLANKSQKSKAIVASNQMIQIRNQTYITDIHIAHQSNITILVLYIKLYSN